MELTKKMIDSILETLTSIAGNLRGLKQDTTIRLARTERRMNNLEARMKAIEEGPGYGKPADPEDESFDPGDGS